MSSKPIRIIRPARGKAAPQPPAMVDSPDPAPAAVPAVEDLAPVPAVEDSAPVAVQLATVGGSPTAGDTLPDRSGGRVCRICWAYAIDPEGHANWHREQDGKARAWDHIKALVLRVFLARGYITTDEKAIATDGNSEGNGNV